MENKLKQALDEAKMFDEVKLEGEIRLGRPTGSSFFVGKSFSKNLININKPNITIDGGGADNALDLKTKATSQKLTAIRY